MGNRVLEEFHLVVVAEAGRIRLGTEAIGKSSMPLLAYRLLDELSPTVPNIRNETTSPHHSIRTFLMNGESYKIYMIILFARLDCRLSEGVGQRVHRLHLHRRGGSGICSDSSSRTRRLSLLI